MAESHKPELQKNVLQAMQRALDEHQTKKAWDLFATLDDEQLTQRTVSWIARNTDKFIANDASFAKIRLAILRSITLEPWVPMLQVAGLKRHLYVEVSLGAFDQFEQELVGEGSLAALTKPPNAVCFFSRLEDMAPNMAQALTQKTVYQQHCQQVLDRMASWIVSARAKWPKALLVLAGFARPLAPAFGLADWNVQNGHIRTIQVLNHQLADLCKQHPGTFFLDADSVLSDIGLQQAYDPSMMAHARQPFSQKALLSLAHCVTRMLAAAFVPRKKCVVLDCDNTLWGGIVGEDGLQHIALGLDYPGSAYVAFQQALLNLNHRGILLAIASKNNEADVFEVLEHHPSQVLKKKHFAGMKINWDDKATNIRALAKELNLGLDAFVFIDDNPMECQWVRRSLPEVLVLQISKDLWNLPSLVFGIETLDALEITQEDQMRSQMYQAQAAREQVRKHAANLDDFLRDLQMVLHLGPADSHSIPRVAQLTQRTNQFNLTTRRYAEADIRYFMESKHHKVFQVRLTDQFGDYGIVGVVILKQEKNDNHESAPVWIDTLLLSCRVLGRQVEHAVVAFVDQQARLLGANCLIGEYIPTPKNGQTKNLFAQFGFTLTGERQKILQWTRLLDSAPLTFPKWLDVKIVEPPTRATKKEHAKALL